MATYAHLIAKLNRPLMLLLLAALLAGGVAWVAYHYLQQREETMKQELAAKGRANATPTVEVVVPNADAGVNTVLNKSNFVSRPVDEDLVYADAILARDFDALEGQKLARPVLRGRPVRVTDLQLPEVHDVAALLPAGMRALTIEIDNLNSIAQTLRPNHRIDIYLLSKRARRPGEAADADERSLEQASLFMQDMVVLATGKQFQDVAAANDKTAQMVRPGDVEGAEQRDFDSITLLVRPSEAARLMMGQKLGSFRVVLRGANDRAALTMRPLRAIDLAGPVPGGRDRGIDFIVGGRGGALVSKLPVSSGTLLADARIATSAAVAGQPAVSGLQLPSSASNQPIPDLRGTK